MKKQTGSSQNSSLGFNKTQVYKPQSDTSNPLEKTLKSIPTDRRMLIQNFLDSNTEMHPHNQRVFSKTMTVEPDEQIKFESIPGVLQQKQFNYGNVYKKQSKKPAIVIVQSLVRRFLAKKRVHERKKYFQKLLREDNKVTIVDQWVKDEKQWAQSILSKLQKPKPEITQRKTISGLDKNNPFYHAQIEMMGEMGILEKEDFIEINPATAFVNNVPDDIKIKKMPLTRLRPKSVGLSRPKVLPFSLPNDGCQIWKALYKKKYGKESLHEISMKEIKITEDYIKIENQEAQKDKARLNKVHKILEKEMPKVTKQKKGSQKKVEDSIGEEIDDEVANSEEQSEIKDEVEEEIPEEEEEPIEEIEDIQSETQQSQIKEDSIPQDSSIIRESVPSAQKSSKIVKESIQEEYGDDFEDEQSQKMKTQHSQYEEDEFESYHSQGDTHRRKITPKSATQKIEPSSFVPEVKSVPIEIDPGWTTKRAKQEAEILLKNYTEKYSQLREVEINDDDFEPLRQEHRDLKFIQQQVNSLITHTGDFYSGWKNQPNAQPSASADQLYAKFQYEFQRLLSMNSLGSRFSRILSSTVVKDIPAANVKNIMSGIEQQMQIVQQVLQSVLFQVQQIFESKSVMEEMRLQRKEMDQKLQWLLFKQDKIINNQLEKQLQERDKDLKKFIAALFEKQRLELGNRKLAATVDPNSLSEALLKNQGLFSYRFDQSAQSKKESSIGKQKDKRSVKEESYYQPDFEEEPSERIKTEKSEQNLYESSYQNSISVDKEVEEASQQSEIEWQNDINLFENTQNSFVDKKDVDAQQIVDYLTEMLMKEIQQDMFPQRGQLQLSQVKNDSSQYSESFEEESASASKEIIPEPIQPAVIKKPQKVEEKIDDFGMGGPAINRDELSKEFDLSDKSSLPEQSEDKEKGKDVKLVCDSRYQAFVQDILNKYGKVLESKQKPILTKFQSIVKQHKTQKSQKQTLGYLLSTQFKFIEVKQVTEQNAFQIVQSLEEQLADQLLKQLNESSKLDVIQGLKQAKVAVLKITETRIPVDAMNSDYTFQEIYNQGCRKPPLKECLFSEELGDVYVQEEAERLGDEACNHIVRQLLANTMGEFDKIMEKRRK